MEVFVEIVSTLGFPIAVCLACGFFIYKLWQQSVEREKLLMSEIAENRKVNDKAIETLAVYAERLGVIENDVREIKDTILNN